MIRLFKPYLGEEELKNIQDAFSCGWIGLGPKVTELEEKWGQYIGCPNTLALNSATAALHLAVTHFNFPRGKKILVPAVTFVATASTVLYNHLEPIFVDIDPETIQMDVKDLERKYTKDCVAVIPVHMTGHPVEIDAVVDFAKSHNLKVIEDCAHTGVGMYKGKRLGTWGDIGCYSFEEKKCMTTGDGGMICAQDPEVITNLRPYRWVGIDKDTWRRAKKSQEHVNLDAMHWHYEIAVLGYKYNMNDLAASIGLAQLKKLDFMNQARASHIDRYLEGMKDLKHIKPLVPYDTKKNVYHIFGIRCEKRDELIIFLTEKGISTGVHYYPLTLQPLFKEYNVGCEIANTLWRTFITLPLFVELTDQEIDTVLDALHEFEKKHWS